MCSYIISRNEDCDELIFLHFFKDVYVLGEYQLKIK